MPHHGYPHQELEAQSSRSQIFLSPRFTLKQLPQTHLHNDKLTTGHSLCSSANTKSLRPTPLQIDTASPTLSSTHTESRGAFWLQTQFSVLSLLSLDRLFPPGR